MMSRNGSAGEKAGIGTDTVMPLVSDVGQEPDGNDAVIGGGNYED